MKNSINHNIRLDSKESVEEFMVAFEEAQQWISELEENMTLWGWGVSDDEDTTSLDLGDLMEDDTYKDLSELKDDE